MKIFEPEALKLALANRDPIILAHWHGDEIAILPQVKRYGLATMTSTSKDGQLIDFVIRKFGGTTSKGSSTRGGAAALKGLVRLMRAGHTSSMAVDGPKGPIHVPKPGVFELSRLTNAKITPVGVACSSSIVFEKSWNKAYVPKPFSTVVIFFTEPWAPISKNDDAKGLELTSRLGSEISRACQYARENLR